MDGLDGLPDELFASLAPESRPSLEQQYGFNDEDLSRCIKVMQCLRSSEEWMNDPRLKNLRSASLVFASHREKFFLGKNPEEYRAEMEKRMRRGLRKARYRLEKELDKQAVNRTQMRQARIEAMQKMLESARPLPVRPPFREPHPMLTGSGAAYLVDADATRDHAPATESPAAAAAAAAPAATDGAAAADAASDELQGYALPSAALLSDEAEAIDDRIRIAQASIQDAVSEEDPTLLRYPRHCYICKQAFYRLHPHYSTLCPECAALNWAKRHATADLSGRVCLVTGGRIKIGYLTALRLLRCGATVIVTSRFPHDTAQRYGKEEDFPQWSHRLHIYGLDMRDITAVERFADLVAASYPRLDVIINNAAQTVRRPPAYYRHLLEEEAKPLPPALAHVVAEFDSHVGAARHSILRLQGPLARVAVAGSLLAHAAELEEGTVSPRDGAGGSSGARGDDGGAPVPVRSVPPPVVVSESMAASAVLTQVPLLRGDERYDAHAFPLGVLDEHRQQLDLRAHNTWRMRLHEVSTVEMVECQAVNAVAPFILNSRLKPLMIQTPGDKYIVNVSAMEGKFYRFKSPFHPHTNMAKAALNMMTRTAAADYAQDRIFMNAVDTGWVTDENPFERARRAEAEHNFSCPIDETDAMARVLDPVFMGLNGQGNVFGKFLKDYRETEW